MPAPPVAPARPIEAPRRPELPAPRRFPVIATIAPLLASLVLFAVTRSAFSLVFAGLGPIVALASSADAARERRRTKRREAARFAGDLSQVAARIDDAHAVERATLGTASPGARDLIDHPDEIPQHWRAGPDRDVSIRLGVASIPSELRYDPHDAHSAAAGEAAVEEALATLRDRAIELTDAPVVVRVQSGVGIIGAVSTAESAARAVLLQLAAVLSPADWSVTVPDDVGAQWLRGLPHSVEVGDPGGGVLFSTPTRSLTVMTARTMAELPRDLDIVVELRADGTALHAGLVVQPGFIGAEEAMGAVATLAQIARRLGIRKAATSTVPTDLDLRDLAQAAADLPDANLSAAVGRSRNGVLRLDLATDGPHAVVGGTTGSGKSELLRSWVLGMAAERSPGAVTFLFVDFKGGASFGSLLQLPHSVGVLTDLSAEQSHRALASLAAELRHRERELARLGLQSIDDGHEAPFPRLVVVVDEYAALVEAFPTLHALFADIAARGRSLGLHLVLCTQRPTGVVRDGILANTPMRISLRVTNAADSVAVLGSDAAAALPAQLPGRALLSLGGGTPVLFQVAHSDPNDVARVVARWSDAPRPRVPWLPPLAACIPLRDVMAGDCPDGIPFAMADLPDEQAQRPACYRPGEHGSLLVIGAGGSGKSGLLAALAAAPSSLEVVRVPNTLPAVWDALTGARDDSGTAARLLAFDDIDMVLAGCADQYQPALIELLTRVLREGPATGTWCVLTAQRLGGALHATSALCGSTVLLRMPNRSEHALAGGQPASFEQNLPPGAGHWRGDRIQVASVPASASPFVEPRSVRVDPASASLVVVSTNPGRFAATLRERAPERRIALLAPAGFGERSSEVEVSRGGLPAILVADPDSWQSQWSLLGSLRRGSSLLADGVSIAEFRTITRSRELPPPFATGERPLWIVPPDDDASRARLL